MMLVRHGIAVGALAAMVGAVTVSAQDGSKGLSPDQERRALEIEAASKPAAVQARAALVPALRGLASTPAGRAGKSVRPLVVPLEAGAATPASGRPAGQRAVVTRYDYASGVTTRTTVDLDSGKAVYVRQNANYPTPLAKEEYELALALARKASAEFDTIVKTAAPAELLITTQLPLYDNPKHPRYGHRMVMLRIEAPATSDRVTVDLSTNEVVRGH
jgi:hypothetical protein